MMQSVKSMPSSATMLRAVPTVDPAEVDVANQDAHVSSDKELRDGDKSETGSVVEPRPCCCCVLFSGCWLVCGDGGDNGNGNSELAAEGPKQLRNDALNSQSSSMRSEITRHDTNSWVVEDANV